MWARVICTGEWHKKCYFDHPGVWILSNERGQQLGLLMKASNGTEIVCFWYGCCQIRPNYSLKLTFGFWFNVHGWQHLHHKLFLEVHHQWLRFAAFYLFVLWSIIYATFTWYSQTRALHVLHPFFISKIDVDNTFSPNELCSDSSKWGRWSQACFA